MGRFVIFEMRLTTLNCYNRISIDSHGYEQDSSWLQLQKTHSSATWLLVLDFDHRYWTQYIYTIYSCRINGWWMKRFTYFKAVGQTVKKRQCNEQQPHHVILTGCVCFYWPLLFVLHSLISKAGWWSQLLRLHHRSAAGSGCLRPRPAASCWERAASLQHRTVRTRKLWPSTPQQSRAVPHGYLSISLEQTSRPPVGLRNAKRGCLV